MSTDRTALSRDQVVAAALHIADTQGVRKVTMRAVADALGVYPNALYWHVSSRAELIGAASTVVFDEIEMPADGELEWQDWVREVARRWRASMRRHPNFAVVIGAQMATTTRAMPFVERVLTTLERIGLPASDVVPTFNAFVAFASGWPTLELATEPTEDSQAWKDSFAAELDGLDAQQFPTLTRLMPSMRNGAFMTRWDSGESNPMDASFEFALDVFIRGIEAKLELPS